ncbi:MAG: hypothetical protein Q7U02_12725 [Desulfosalsimonadaceae bacterium]|nr:hypothetical protein [Desulfosalsimonadaceae bacterium]
MKPVFRWPAQQGAVNIVAGCRMRFVITDMSSGIPPAASGIFSCSIAGGFPRHDKSPARGISGAGLDSFVAFLAR